jgi:hypothetical protein
MAALQSVKTYYRRFLGLGWARVFLVVGVLFTLLAMASPLWAMTFDDAGGDYTTTTFGWTTVTVVMYHGGVWTETRIQSYSPNAFDAPATANAMGGSYLALLVFLIVLVAVIVLYSLKWSEQLPGLGLLIVGLIVVVTAFVALLYPVFTAPTAASLDMGNTAISGYWGSIAPTPGTALSWGAALGWWFLVVAVILGIVGGVWPYLKSMRQPMVRAPPPREWQVER